MTEYEIRIHGQQYVIVPKGYDPLKHGGVFSTKTYKTLGHAYGTRQAAERALAERDKDKS